MSSASLGLDCQERLIGAKNVCSPSQHSASRTLAQERKPQLWWRQTCFLFAVAAIDFYQRGEGLNETVVCQWRMLMCLEFPNSIGVLALGKRRVKGAPGLVATRDGGLVELRWLLSGNRQLFRHWRKDKLSAESLKINPFVRLESSVFFTNSLGLRWHIFSSDI